jgi:hypothetical protein
MCITRSGCSTAADVIRCMSKVKLKTEALTEQVEDALIEDLVEAAAAVVANSASRGSHFSADTVKKVL